MRCPKCGYISFDNVEKCLKCKKNIASASSVFQGSVLNVTTPVFLKLVPDEEETEEMELGSDELELADEEFEISDPELDILLDEEEGSTAEIQLDLEDQDLEKSALDQLNDDLSEIEAFSEEDSAEDEVAPDLSMLDEAEVEDAFADEEPQAEPEEALSLEVPDELADLSDLSPPEKTPVVEEPKADADVDLDFGDLGDDFGEEAAAVAAAVPEPKKPQEQKLSLDMDEDLDFELDLGGLSIHDDDK